MRRFDQGNLPTILVVEDSLPDYESISRAFSKLNVNNPVYRCESGEDALDFLYRRKEYSDAEKAPRPGLVLLDLNLPGTDGREALKEMKNDQHLKTIPVVILTTSSSDRDIDECYRNGASSYITKAADWESFFKAMENFKNYYLGTAILPNHMY